MFLRSLDYFCAVARLGSYRRAAKECFVSQSAISQQIKALEAELGVALTERKGRGFVLTLAGEKLARGGQQILADLDNLEQEVRGFSVKKQELHVGYLNRYAGWEIQAAVAAFARRHPDVVITAQSGDHEALYEGILDGTYDILVSDRRRQLSDKFENQLLFLGYDYVEVSEVSHFARCECVSISDLVEEACILVAQTNKRDDEQKYWRETLGFDCDFLFAETLEEAHMLVASNRGFFPIEFREPVELTDAVLRYIPIVDGEGIQRRHEYYAFWLRERSNQLVREFSQILAGLFGKNASN